MAVALDDSSRRNATLARCLIGAFGIAAVAGITVTARGRSRPADDHLQLTIPAPQNSSFQTSGAQFAVSPDGRLVLFVAVQNAKTALWVQSLGASAATRLPGTEGASYPFWSPDAQSIAFFAEAKLKVAPAGGGAVAVLCDAPSGRGGTWSSDGVIVFTPSPADALFRVESDGGRCEPLTHFSRDTERSHRWPQFLSDGRHFLYLATFKLGSNLAPSELRIGSLDAPNAASVAFRTDSSAAYGAGHILFMRDGVLMALKFDNENAVPVGDAFPIAGHVRTDMNFHTAVSASSTGVLVSQQDNSPRTTRLTWMDRSGQQLGTIGESGQYMNIALAPDDRRVAVSLVSGTPENRDIWVIDSTGGTPTRLTHDPADDAVPLWSRDGRSIVFESYRTGPASIFRRGADAWGGEVQLLNSATNDIPEDWSADGKFVVFMRSVSITNPDLWILPLTGSRKPFPLLETMAAEDNARFDRTGRWIAYTSNASGRYEVYVRPFPPSAGEYRISRDGGGSPVWRADGKELFFLASDGTLMSAAIDSSSGFRSGDPRVLFQTGVSEIVTSGNRHQYGVSKDGRRFLINRAEAHDDSSPLSAVLSWSPR